MEHQTTVPRISKSQRENHSEIERKRRERMKRDTEFLRRQIPSSQCKDKLSIFQLGAERLIQYTDKLGKRDYIINNAEYSRLVTNNFDGFDVHIRCFDGEVLHIHKNVEGILDMSVSDIIGSHIEDLVEPSPSTKEIIDGAFQGSELQWDVFKGVISRNFILALRCGPRVPLHHCVYGSDGRLYRFIEFCGDLIHQTDCADDTSSTIVFRGLCRPLDPACGTVVRPSVDGDSSADFHYPDLKQHFTVRLSNVDHRIIEAVGDFESLLGLTPDLLLRSELRDLVAPCERPEVDRMLNEAAHCTTTIQRSLHLVHAHSCRVIEFDAHLTAIRVGGQVYCFVCRMNAPNRLLSAVSQNANPVSDGCPQSGFASSARFLGDSQQSGNLNPLPSNPENSLCQPIYNYVSDFVKPDEPSGSDATDYAQSTCFPGTTPYATTERLVFDPTVLDNHAPLAKVCDQVEMHGNRFGFTDTSYFRNVLTDGHQTYPERFMDMLQKDTGNM